MSAGDSSAEWDGRPQNPERDGWHWVQHLHVGAPAAWHWFRGRWESLLTADEAAGGFRYLGPCLTPDQVSDRLVAARRDALAEADGALAKGLQRGLREALALAEAAYQQHAHASRVMHATAARDLADAIRAKLEAIDV